MRLLSLETSARAVSAAITEDTRILAWGYQDTGLTHSRTLMPMVEHLFRNAGLKPGEIDAVAVAAGPGSFTGIRIGVSAAKGLAFSLEKPAIAVSTLGAMARNVSFADGYVVCAMDARRAQVYNANFTVRSGAVRRLTADRAIALPDLAAELKRKRRPILLVGDGAHLAGEVFSRAGIPCRMAPPHLLLQNAASVAMEALEKARQGRFVTARELAAFYLRPPYAVPLRETLPHPNI